MSKKVRMVSIPRWIETVPEGDPVRVRLEWRAGLIEFALQSKEKRSGTKEESK